MPVSSPLTLTLSPRGEGTLERKPRPPTHALLFARSWHEAPIVKREDIGHGLRRSTVPRSSSSRTRPSSSSPAGARGQRAERPRPHARRAAPARAARHQGRSHPARGVQQPLHGDRRADGGGAAQHGAVGQHQGAARLLLRGVRRRRPRSSPTRRTCPSTSGPWTARSRPSSGCAEPRCAPATSTC